MTSDADVDAIHEGKRDDILVAVYEQAKELHGQEELNITCICGKSGPLREAFQCFHCEVYFCPDCAEDHFGSVTA